MRPDGFEPVAGRPFSLHGDWGSVDCQILEVEPTGACPTGGTTRTPRRPTT
jgi:hypothetical protein